MIRARRRLAALTLVAATAGAPAPSVSAEPAAPPGRFALTWPIPCRGGVADASR